MPMGIEPLFKTLEVNDTIQTFIAEVEFFFLHFDFAAIFNPEKNTRIAATSLREIGRILQETTTLRCVGLTVGGCFK